MRLYKFDQLFKALSESVHHHLMLTLDGKVLKEGDIIKNEDTEVKIVDIDYDKQIVYVLNLDETEGWMCSEEADNMEGMKFEPNTLSIVKDMVKDDADDINNW